MGVLVSSTHPLSSSTVAAFPSVRNSEVGPAHPPQLQRVSLSRASSSPASPLSRSPSVGSLARPPAVPYEPDYGIGTANQGGSRSHRPDQTPHQPVGLGRRAAPAKATGFSKRRVVWCGHDAMGWGSPPALCRPVPAGYTIRYQLVPYPLAPALIC